MSSVFSQFFLEDDLLKVNKILGLTFLKARKDLELHKTAFCHFLLPRFMLDVLFIQPPFSRVEKAVS